MRRLAHLNTRGFKESATDWLALRGYSAAGACGVGANIALGFSVKHAGNLGNQFITVATALWAVNHLQKAILGYHDKRDKSIYLDVALYGVGAVMFGIGGYLLETPVFMISGASYTASALYKLRTERTSPPLQNNSLFKNWLQELKDKPMKASTVCGLPGLGMAWWGVTHNPALPLPVKIAYVAFGCGMAGFQYMAMGLKDQQKMQPV